MNDLGTDLRNSASDISSTVGAIKVDTDIKIFIDNNRSPLTFFGKEEFIPYSVN